MPNVPEGDEARMALVAGLRQLADFYEQHPELPVPLYPKFLHNIHVDNDEAGIEQVQAMAAVLGVPVTYDDTGAEVEVRLGALEFKPYYLTRQHMADYVQRISYNQVVQPDRSVAA